MQNIELEPAARKSIRVVDGDGKPITGCEAAGLDWDNSSVRHLDTNTPTAFGVEPNEERLITVGHQERRLVGTAVVKASDPDPVVKLGAGGTASGRVVDQTGTPIEGVIVYLNFERRPVDELYKHLHPAEQVVSDAKGRFRFETLTPGSPYRLTFSKGKKNLGPNYRAAPKYKIEKHGETKDLGNLKLEPAKADGEE